MICGSTVAGEPLPSQLQFKYDSGPERQKFSLGHLVGMKSVVVKFGGTDFKPYSCTIGMNNKGVMNGIEFEKYIRTAILRLYLDIADMERKLVIMKVDSVPGRTNLPMFAHIRCFGIYIMTCVPNTTQVTQEIYQNYVLFKSLYRKNLQTLSYYLFACKETLSMLDIPLLLFGGILFNGIVLPDAFTESFSVEINLSVWRKVGDVPLTGVCLYSSLVSAKLRDR